MHLLSCCATVGVVVASRPWLAASQARSWSLEEQRRRPCLGEPALAIGPIGLSLAGYTEVVVSVVYLQGRCEVVNIGSEMRRLWRSYWLGKLPCAKGWHETTSISLPFPSTSTTTLFNLRCGRRPTLSRPKPAVEQITPVSARESLLACPDSGSVYQTLSCGIYLDLDLCKTFANGLTLNRSP